MIAPLLVLAAGLLTGLVVVGARAFEARVWRQRLRTYGLTLPRDVTTDQLSQLFGGIAAITHRAKWSVLPLPPVVIETVASSNGIQHRLLVSRANQTATLSAIRAALPGLRMVELQQPFRPRVVHALELTQTSRRRPLAIDRSDAVATTLLSTLQPLRTGTTIISQLVLTSAGTPPRVAPPGRGSSFGELPTDFGLTMQDAEAVSQLRSKYEAPLLNAVVRVGVATADVAESKRLGGRVWSSYRALNAPGVRLVRRYLPSRLVATRLNGFRLPLLRWPLLLNSREVIGLAGLPVGSAILPGVQRGAARQLPPPTALPRRGLVLAHSNYPGQEGRPLAISSEARREHVWISGPTGSGKSWLLASNILQDIAAGHGTIVIDVKGDLVTDVAARLRPEDEARLVIIDPTNRARPVGLNVLQHVGTEASRELAVDNVLHIFRELWHGFWGPRTDWVMRAGLSTLTLAHDRQSKQYTLVELSPLLTNPTFRRDVLKRTSLPADLALFWRRYEAMSDNERAQIIGPTLNKLDAFTSRSAIRLMLGQSDGIDLTDIFTKRSAILVSLDKGQLGTETTSLLGALTVAALWQATLTRAAVPMDRRRPAFAVIDEAQDIVRLPLAIADILSQARGYGLGMTLANQYAAQLPDSVRTAILGTVRTHVVFALDYDDARVLERRFQPLTKDDLQGLQKYEVAIRASVGGHTLMPATGVTQPLPEPITDPDAVRARAAARYGVLRVEVEQAMADRLQLERPPATSFGRERREDES